MIGRRNVTEAATEHPIRTSPPVGSARNSISLIPCLNSSNTARVRVSSASPYIVGSQALQDSGRMLVVVMPTDRRVLVDLLLYLEKNFSILPQEIVGRSPGI